MPSVTIEEAQRRLPELVSNLSSEGEVVITDGEQPIARLTSIERPSIWHFKPRSVGGLLREVPSSDDDILDEMLSDDAETKR